MTLSDAPERSLVIYVFFLSRQGAKDVKQALFFNIRLMPCFMSVRYWGRQVVHVCFTKAQ